jgi:hypothetical protein
MHSKKHKQAQTAIQTQNKIPVQCYQTLGRQKTHIHETKIQSTPAGDGKPITQTSHIFKSSSKTQIQKQLVK